MDRRLVLVFIVLSAFVAGLASGKKLKKAPSAYIEEPPASPEQYEKEPASSVDKESSDRVSHFLKALNSRQLTRLQKFLNNAEGKDAEPAVHGRRHRHKRLGSNRKTTRAGEDSDLQSIRNAYKQWKANNNLKKNNKRVNDATTTDKKSPLTDKKGLEDFFTSREASHNANLDAAAAEREALRMGFKLLPIDHEDDTDADYNLDEDDTESDERDNDTTQSEEVNDNSEEEVIADNGVKVLTRPADKTTLMKQKRDEAQAKYEKSRNLEDLEELKVARAALKAAKKKSRIARRFENRRLGGKKQRRNAQAAAAAAPKKAKKMVRFGK